MTEKTIDHRLAWLAGIIDGEGWIGFRSESRGAKKIAQRVYKQRRSRYSTYEYARWYVAIGNTDTNMLAEVMAIADVVGAPYCFNISQKQKNHYKQQYRVNFVSKKGCHAILEAVLPYLINKRGQAELTLRAMQHRYGSADLAVRNSRMVTLRMDDEFRKMETEIRAMNKRGVSQED